MTESQDLLQGMLYYQKHQYISALKHFTKCADQHNQISQMIYQTLQAVTNMQLCNYNQAAQQLNYLRAQLSDWTKHSNQQKMIPQVELLKVKVLANLLVIHLLNCDEDVDNILQELIQIIQDRYERNKTAGVSMFKALLKSLFGFQSFQQIHNQLNSTLSKIHKIDIQKPKLNKEVKPILPSPILLSSLSIYSHLSGNIEDAIKLQKAAYQLSKSNNPIAAVISLRHLQEIQRELSNEKQRRYYHKQLMVLMSNEQLQGIAEETLFRNYSLKIEIAHKVVFTLIEKQKQLEDQPNQDLLRYAVLCKLKNMKNGNNSQKIDTVVNLLKSDLSILNIMVQSQFIQQSIQQYHQKLAQFIQIIKKNKQRLFYRNFFQKMQKIPVNIAKPEKQSRVININILDQHENLNNNHQKRLLTPSKGKKHNFASSLYMPMAPKNITNFRSQLPQRQQQNSNNTLNESQLSIKTPINSNRQKNHVYLNEAQKQRPLYKIGKDTKKGNKIEKAKQIKGQPKRQNSERSRSKDEVAIKQKNTMDQFLRTQSIIPNKKQEYIPLPVRDIKAQLNQEIQEIQTFQIKKNQNPLRQNNPTIEKSNQQTHRSQVNNIESLPNKESSRSEAPNNPIKNAEISKIPKNPPNKNNSQYNGFIPLGSSKLIEHNAQISNLQQKMQLKLRKYINLCVTGQYIIKRHFSSDGGAQRFLKLSLHKDKLLWGPDEQNFDQSSYPIQDIKGLVYGRVTETMVKQANIKLQPWKCFSLIMKKRTFDVYCHQDRDLKFWLPGLSLYLKDINYSNEKYKSKKINSSKVEKKIHNNITFGEKNITRFYSVGRVLWKRFLMRMQSQFLKTKKKEKRNAYQCANAYAIVVGAVRLCSYKPQKLKTIV